MMPVVEFEMFVPGTVFTLNGERKEHYSERAARVKVWREAAWAVVMSQHSRRARHPLTDVEFEATPILKNGRHQDVGGCFPVAKAVIDGLVDARVLEDDGPTIVRRLSFCTPERAKVGDGEGLRLRVKGVTA